MALPDLTAESAYIFRLTHKDNLPWILDNGLHCRASALHDPNFVSIGIVDLIEKRSLRKVLEGPGGTLSDYIPFYFTPLSMMAYNIHTGRNVQQRRNDELVILVSSLPELRKANASFLFTDRHASLIAARFYSDLAYLDRVDWRILQNRDFSRDNEDIGKTSRYQAEALVHRHMPIGCLLQVACWDDDQKLWVESVARQRGSALQVAINRGWYFP